MGDNALAMMILSLDTNACMNSKEGDISIGFKLQREFKFNKKCGHMDT